MTDQINDQISAFIDNELGADESAMLVRRFEREPEARARAMRYTLIGAALRGELLEPHPSVLRQRLSAALSGAVPSQARRQQSWAASAARPLVGFGIAAAVALVAIGTLRNVGDPASGAGAVPTAALAVDSTGAPEPPSYVVPQAVAASPVVTPPIRLTNYLIHHGDYASGLTRTTVNSNVVGVAVGASPGVRPVEEAETAVTKPVPLEAPAQE
jgi:sigma-E factor negative regulatory protein RseA